MEGIVQVENRSDIPFLCFNLIRKEIAIDILRSVNKFHEVMIFRLTYAIY